MTDRPARIDAEEIEITPEMIEAGVAELLKYDPSFSNERDVVVGIFNLLWGREAS
jgi:hypothetical protein